MQRDKGYSAEMVFVFIFLIQDFVIVANDVMGIAGGHIVAKVDESNTINHLFNKVPANYAYSTESHHALGVVGSQNQFHSNKDYGKGAQEENKTEESATWTL